MKVTSLEAVFRELNAAGVRSIVVGGVAVNAHGYQRLTNDLDLVLQLDPENVLAGLQALQRIGFRPLLAVRAEAFADPGQRRRWIQEKILQVFRSSATRTAAMRRAGTRPGRGTHPVSSRACEGSAVCVVCGATAIHDPRECQAAGAFPISGGPRMTVIHPDRETAVEPNWQAHRREQLAAVEEMGELGRRSSGGGAGVRAGMHVVRRRGWTFGPLVSHGCAVGLP
jgi:hypothetical protein